ncbi:MAG: amidohydrolase [Bacteroidetes bacterium]|nr:amidohydrolase [Bacteroidota bacterium]
MEKLLSPEEINKIIDLRKFIHANPELAHSEFSTADTIQKFLWDKPDKIIKRIGETGIAFIYDSGVTGKTILFRAELDALPIQEINSFPYKSTKENISHKCGHDGHMAILAGLGIVLSKHKINKGKIILLFQPAEEIGEGAQKILNDEKFKEIKPDYIFALHNLPGFELGSIITRHENFASASKGMIIKLYGKTSHAAEPENGINPSIAMSNIIIMLNNLVDDLNGKLIDFSLVTVVCARLGEKAFGTNPGYAEVMATFRSYNDDDMKLLTESAGLAVKQIAEKENLKEEITYTEEFPATVNSIECIKIIKEVIKENNIKEIKKELPFKWSEDFGHFTYNFNGALFGIGAGLKTPQLHNPDYDFPDEIIETGIMVFYHIAKKISRL